MPELPEAETIARQLHARLAGRRLGEVTVCRAEIVHGDRRPLGEVLTGRTVQRVWRRAKRVVVDLDGDLRLVFRLGMTGSIVVCPIAAPVEKHTHLRIGIECSLEPLSPAGEEGRVRGFHDARIGETSSELRFRDPRRFGGVWCDGRDADEGLGDIGLEPLEATARQFRVVLSRRRQIKALLMDQSAIAGLGNIYCDESLHAAGIHPLHRADRLDHEAALRLLRAIRRILRRAIRMNGSTLMDYRDAAGREGSFQKLHRVYQRHGQPCRTCGTPIRRILAAGRSTFLCPKCQPKKQKRRNK